MRNIDDRAAAGSVHTPALSRRRRRIAIGAVGLTAALGAGAYLMSGGDADRDVPPAGQAPPVVAGTSATTPPTTAASVPEPTSSSTAAATATTRPAQARRSTQPTPTPVPVPVPVAEEIAEARADAAKDGHPLQRPLTPSPGLPSGPVDVTNTGSVEHGGTIRMMSARYDLTGQRELLWAADRGRQVGNARCTQNFRFSNEQAAQERPTMLLCYRTSAGKSVVTVAVVKKGRPSASASVEAIDRKWAELG